MIGNVSQPNYAFSKCVNKKVTLLAGISLVALEAKNNRAYASFVNLTNTAITLILGDSNNNNLNQGIVLIGKGSCYEITRINLYTGKISALSSNNCELAIVEGEY